MSFKVFSATNIDPSDDYFFIQTDTSIIILKIEQVGLYGIRLKIAEGDWECLSADEKLDAVTEFQRIQSDTEEVEMYLDDFKVEQIKDAKLPKFLYLDDYKLELGVYNTNSKKFFHVEELPNNKTLIKADTNTTEEEYREAYDFLQKCWA